MWIQVNAADMMPQLIERNSSTPMNELINNLSDIKNNILLAPDT